MKPNQILISLLASLLVACGQPGPLYLPKQSTPEPVKTEPNSKPEPLKNK